MHSSSISQLILGFAVFTIVSGQATSIFVDSSCTSKTGFFRGTSFNSALNQGLSFAQIAAARLGDDGDTDAQNYFRFIFGASNSKNQVASEFISTDISIPNENR